MGMKFYVALPYKDGGAFQPEGPLIDKRQKIEDGVVIEPAKTVWFSTDLAGLIRIPDDEFQAVSLKAMDRIIKEHYSRGDKRILGPFNTDREALAAREEQRPKSVDEQLVIERASTSKLAEENSKLMAKLAALEAAEKAKEKK